MLQKGFAEARDRLSMGDRKSAASSFASDSGNEEHGAGHRNHDFIHAITSRMPSMGGSSTHSDSRSEHRGRFFSKRHSHDSAGSSEENKNNESSPSTPTTREYITRNPSAISACSFGSVSGDELPMILSEEDEHLEDDTEETAHKNDFKPSEAQEATEKQCPPTKSADAPERAPPKKKERSEKKRRKRSKDRDSRCVIQ